MEQKTTQPEQRKQMDRPVPKKRSLYLSKYDTLVRLFEYKVPANYTLHIVNSRTILCGVEDALLSIHNVETNDAIPIEYSCESVLIHYMANRLFLCDAYGDTVTVDARTGKTLNIQRVNSFGIYNERALTLATETGLRIQDIYTREYIEVSDKVLPLAELMPNGIIISGDGNQLSIHNEWYDTTTTREIEESEMDHRSCIELKIIEITMLDEEHFLVWFRQKYSAVEIEWTDPYTIIAVCVYNLEFERRVLHEYKSDACGVVKEIGDSYVIIGCYNWGKYEEIIIVNWKTGETVQTIPIEKDLQNFHVEDYMLTLLTKEKLVTYALNESVLKQVAQQDKFKNNLACSKSFCDILFEFP